MEKNGNLLKVYMLTVLCMLGTGIIFLSGCFVAAKQAPQEPLPPLPQAKWGNNFKYSFKLPEDAEKAEPGSVPVTVIVVNPWYKEDESALKTPLYTKVGKGFSASMAVDADKVLIAKGMTTLGPYPTLHDVIYAHKKKATLTLAPKVFITVKVKYIDNWHAIKGSTPSKPVEYRMCRTFKMIVGGWISFVMQEPLSGEKMWIKKLEFDEKEMTGVELYGATPTYRHTYGFFGGITGKYVSGYTKSKELVFDGKVEAVADYIQEMYPIIMNKFWTYLDTEEMLKLKKQTKEIRELKRY